METKLRTKKNWNLFITDVIVVASLSFFSLRAKMACSILVLAYLTLRLFFSPIEDSMLIVLLFSANTNIFFLFGAPICNVVILVALLRLLSKGKIIINSLVKVCHVVCFYELAHIVLYDTFNILQCVVWVSAVAYVGFYASNYCIEFDLDRAKLYYLGSVFISTVHGCFYRISSGRGFSVASFNINEKARFGGGYYDPNYYSLSCLVLFCFVLEHICKKTQEGEYFSKIPKAFYFLFPIVLLFFCVSGLSKSFLIMLIVLIVLYFPVIISLSMSGRRALRYFIVVAIVVFAIINISSYNYIGLISKIINRFTSAQSINELTTSRFGIVQRSLQYIFDHPLLLTFGVGVQTYGLRLGSGTGGYMHNYLAEILCTFGVVGFFAYISYFLRMYALCKSRNSIYNTSMEAKYVSHLPLIIWLGGLIALNAIEVEVFYILFFLLIANATNTH